MAKKQAIQWFRRNFTASTGALLLGAAMNALGNIQVALGLAGRAPFFFQAAGMAVIVFAFFAAHERMRRAADGLAALDQRLSGAEAELRRWSGSGDKPTMLLIARSVLTAAANELDRALLAKGTVSAHELFVWRNRVSWFLGKAITGSAFESFTEAIVDRGDFGDTSTIAARTSTRVRKLIDGDLPFAEFEPSYPREVDSWGKVCEAADRRAGDG